jgi:phage terminase large subunit GpA-like protein
MMINITIPGPPIAKKRPKFARRGKFVTTYNPQDSEEGRWKVKGANHFLDCEVYCYAAACEAGSCVGSVENEIEPEEETEDDDGD